jgi:PPM family protein phosphatase
VSLFGYDHRPIRLSVFGKTHTGMVRRDNQDNFLLADLSAGVDGGFCLDAETEPLLPVGTTEIVLGPKGVLAVVADGMGGAAAGAVASRLAVTAIRDELLAGWGNDRLETPQQFARRLRDAVETANTRIHEAARRHPGYRGMGTTVTAVGVLENYLFLAQVGDSRAYLVRGGEARQLTRDQSLVQQLVDSGQLTEEEAERSVQANMILQALGTNPSVEVDLSYQEVRRGDLLVVCSDGLTRAVRRDEIAVAANRTPDPACLCGELVELANERGGPDNVTVLALCLDGDGLSEPHSTDTVGHRRFELGA